MVNAGCFELKLFEFLGALHAHSSALDLVDLDGILTRARHALLKQHLVFPEHQRLVQVVESDLVVLDGSALRLFDWIP